MTVLDSRLELESLVEVSGTASREQCPTDEVDTAVATACQKQKR